jgi:dihydrolipoamide dehydrogenase
MSETFEVRIPDIGAAEDVEVAEILVQPGDRVEEEQGLVALESDKAAMELPSPRAGVVDSIAVSRGDKVKEGTLIAILRLEDATGPEPEPEPERAREAEPEPEQEPEQEPEPEPTAEPEPEPKAEPEPEPKAEPEPEPKAEPEPEPKAEPEGGRDARARPAKGPAGDVLETDVLVLGAGVGGYPAAFRAADLGKKVVLVERYESLGGVCLNVGCIPSKALLHVAKVIDEAAAFSAHGVDFGRPRIDLGKLRAWKQNVVGRLTKGVRQMADGRRVQVLTGTGTFTGPHEMAVETASGTERVRFAHAVIAAGSQPAKLPFLPNDDPRVMDSTDALELADVPERLLVIGGGIIGLEMAAFFSALGSRITVVELLDGLMPGVDRDLVRRLERIIGPRYESILTSTKITAAEARDDGLHVRLEGPEAPAEEVRFDRLLVAVGRTPNGHKIGAEAAGVRVDERGFIPVVDKQMRTNVPHIFAVGDIVGNPMLAHKASHQGKVAAEVAAGHKSGFDARVIPSVAYTDPEIAWVGLTEEEAKRGGLAFDKALFPWSASGRSLAFGRDEGLTKLLFDKETGRLIGAGLVGPNAGDLIAETALAIELGCDAEDIALTIHPHPTLSETIAFAAEVQAGTVTDLPPQRRR